MFLTAFHDDEFQLIDDLRPIAINYLKGWFVIDVLAILPFDQIFVGGGDQVPSENINGMVRIARLGRMYKLLKLTRLIRIIKIMK